jgi:hypothetical protein
MKLEPSEHERLVNLINTGKFRKMERELIAEMAIDTDKFLATRGKRGFTKDEVLVLREMYQKWKGITCG